MNAKEIKSDKVVSVRESALLSLVASKLKDRDLFPKKIADAKKALSKAKFTNL